MRRIKKSWGSLIQTILTFSNDIGMEFEIKKCAMLLLKKGHAVTSKGIKLPDESLIKSVKDGEMFCRLNHDIFIVTGLLELSK